MKNAKSLTAKKSENAVSDETKVEKKHTKAQDTNPVTVAKKIVVPSKEKVESKRVEKIEKTKRAGIPAPKSIPLAIDDVANPVVAATRNKRALAIALATVEQDPATLAKLIVESGIVCKQAPTAAAAKDPELLNNNEWSGRNYANWAINNVADYTGKFPDKVKLCMKFAKTLRHSLKVAHATVK